MEILRVENFGKFFNGVNMQSKPVFDIELKKDLMAGTSCIKE